jgi:AcrR family transcriptional regulator
MGAKGSNRESMSGGGETGLPASIEAAWGLRERPSKGPKPGLSLERIVDAAVNVAATEGIEAVSMNRVATELGSSAMALYRYVAAKDELLELMVDRAAASVLSTTAVAAEDWRAGLSRWAWSYHELLREHSWVLRIPISGPPTTPNQIAWLENGLATMRDTGLHEGEKMSVILLVTGYVRNEATLTAELAAAAAASGKPFMPTWGQLIAQLTDPQRFPALHAAIASGIFEQDDDPDDEFAFGLERVLDGIEVLVRART